MTLFTTPLQRITTLHVGGPVLAENSSDATYASDASGKRWVRKPLDWNLFLAESISWSLGRMLGVPIPDAAYHKDVSGELCWLLEFQPHCLHWDASRYLQILNLEDLGKMIALDALVGNTDRNHRNILLQRTIQGFRCWIIDHERTRIGTPADIRSLGLEVLSPWPYHARGLPLSLLEHSALTTATLAQHLRQDDIQKMIVSHCSVVNEPDHGTMIQSLLRRLNHAPDLVAQYLDLLRHSP